MSNPNFPRFPVPGHGREPQPGGATSSSSPGSRFNGLNSGAAPFVPRMVEGAGLAGRMMFGSGAAAGTGATTRSLALAAAVPRGATSVLAGPTAAADFAPSSRDTVYVPVNHDVPLLPIGHHVNLGSASAAGDAMISSSGAPAGAHQYMTNPYAGDAMINSPPSLSLVLTRTWSTHRTSALPPRDSPLLPPSATGIGWNGCTTPWQNSSSRCSQFNSNHTASPPPPTWPIPTATTAASSPVPQGRLNLASAPASSVSTATSASSATTTAAADFAPSSRDIPLLPIGQFPQDHVNLGSASAAGDAMINSSALAGAHPHMVNPPPSQDDDVREIQSARVVQRRGWVSIRSPRGRATNCAGEEGQPLVASVQ
uniref:Uncharacterized protein n=1 Tax=Oryza rufipogon TaxID=4529 RepID=A0A0E0Q3T7_ORYRU